MSMSLTILDLILIGATCGLTTLTALFSAMLLMKRADTKRKVIVMEEMLSQMHDKAQTESEFAKIVEKLRDQRGNFNE